MKILKGKEQLTEPYGTPRKGGIHEGIDVVKYKNQLDYIVAIEDGKVDSILTGITGYIGSGKGSYGNYIWIKHTNGFRSFYAHLSRVDVKKGQTVKKGQVIGYMGNTGKSEGAHLHFEIEKNGKLINPTDYVFGNKTFSSDINKLARTTTALNVRRKEGSIKSKIVRTLPKNTDIYIRKRMPNKDGYEWYSIYYNLKKGKYQNSGYIARNKIGSKSYYFNYTTTSSGSGSSSSSGSTGSSGSTTSEYPRTAITTTSLNVRRGSGSLSAPIKKTIPANSTIKIREQKPNKDGYTWYLIYYNLKGKFYQNTGYVARNPIGSKERYWEYI